MCPTNSVRNREERKTLHEKCLWCLSAKKPVYEGLIVNESASGLLLNTDRALSLDATLYLLTPCFGEPLTPENLTARQLIQYPITRKGRVVRLAGGQEYGIQFEPENKPAEFRRWYREKSTLYTLLTQKVLVVTLEGEINLETSALLQSLINGCKKKICEFVFSLERVTAFFGAAAAVIKTIIRDCGSEGRTATVLYNDSYEKVKQLVEEVRCDSVFVFHESSTYPLETVPASRMEQDAEARSTGTATQTKHPPAKDDILFLVVAAKQVHQRRLHTPIADAGGNVISVSLIHEAMNKILEYQHHFVIVDVEIEELNLLVMFNQLLTKRLNRMPELIICGPKYVDRIVKEAIKLPVHTYLEKPYTDRDYLYTIQSILERKFSE